MFKTILQLRREAIQKIIDREVKLYIKRLFITENYMRTCASCGKDFAARTRWHFFCKSECRKEFYRGQFKPRD